MQGCDIVSEISVIVPVYKVEPYIHRCVDSILAQTFTDFELILVDDGSPDNCGAICDEYAAQDSRVRVIHQENRGQAAARNAGIDWAFANSDSEWLSFIDSDDWVHPMYLEALYQGAVDMGLPVVIGGFQRTTGENPIMDAGALHANVRNTEEYFCAENVNAIVIWGKIYKKADFTDIRYPVGKDFEDEFTTYKILFRYENVAVISEPIYAYFQNKKGKMAAKWTPKNEDAIDALQQQTDYFAQNDFSKAYQFSLRHLIENMCQQIVSAKKFGTKYGPEIKCYKKRYRTCIKKYRRDLSLREKLKARIAIHPKLNFIFAFHGNVVNNGLPFALKALGKRIRRRTK